MRYQYSDADLLERAANAIQDQERQIKQLHIKIFEIKSRVCTFLFGEPDRENVELYSESSPTFAEQLKERATELRKVDEK